MGQIEAKGVGSKVVMVAFAWVMTLGWGTCGHERDEGTPDDNTV